MLSLEGTYVLIDVAVACIYWHTAYSLSYRQSKNWLSHGRSVDCNWRTDQTYVGAKNIWKYLGRADGKRSFAIDMLPTVKRETAVIDDINAGGIVLATVRCVKRHTID